MSGLRRAAATLVLLTAPLIAAPEDSGVTGSVLAPDGSPVPTGTVTFHFQGGGTTTAIERDGRFRLVPHAVGTHEMHIVVAGFSPYRAKVTVPASRALTLPPISLAPPSHFRVRFVSRSGEAVTAPRLLRQIFDVSGAQVREPHLDRGDQTDADGTVTIGPLPRGVMTLAVVAPPLAGTRLPDVRIAGEPLIDGGTVVLEPGALLQVDVVDGQGAPVAGQDVYLEDAVPLSPLMFQPARTDAGGRVTFDHLAAGQYRVHTRTIGPCHTRPLMITRAVSIAGDGTLRIRLVVGGTGIVRLTSGGAPLVATEVRATPEPPPSPPPAWLRGRPEVLRFARRPYGASPCAAATDGEGRVTFPNFPPGPARIDVQLPGSTWVRRITLPVEPREVMVEVPSGFLPLRVGDARTGNPVGSADVTWISGGFRVEAMTSATGEALLRGVAAAPGTLAIEARAYERANAKLPEPPAMLYEMALEPARPMTLECRVRGDSGEPLPGAVVELIPENPIEIAHFAPADEKGVATFVDPPQGPLRFVGHAEGYAPASGRPPPDAFDPIVLTLIRQKGSRQDPPHAR